jgi:hypothetical protein
MPTQPANNRLAELLDGVRQEFDSQAARTTEYEQQRKSYSYSPFDGWTTIRIPEDRSATFGSWL